VSEAAGQPASAPAPSQRLSALRERWAAMAPRERRGVLLATTVLGLYLFWAVALQPALRTLRTAPGQIAALDAELQAMQRLAAEAGSLRALPQVPAGQAGAALQAATARLGGAGKLVLQGDRAVLTLTDCAPAAFGAWLAEVRTGARAGALEARLTRGEAGLSGTVVVAIGGQP